MNRIKWTKEAFMEHIQQRISPFDVNRNAVPDSLEMVQQLMTEAQIETEQSAEEVIAQ